MSIRAISLFLLFSIFILIAFGIYKIHSYPGKVAAKRKHPQFKAIEVTSLTGLLFFPLWVLALIWAHSNAIVGNLYNKGDFGEAPNAPETQTNKGPLATADDGQNSETNQ